jgi:hypothetical protein
VSRLGQVVVAAAHSGVGIAQGGSGQGRGGRPEEDDLKDRHATGLWDTEAACDLVDQTRGLLILAQRQGLDLFAGDGAFRADQHLPLPTKPKKKGGRLSSFALPIIKPEPPRLVRLADQLAPSKGLHTRLVDILASLLTTDGLHTVQRFRPLLPPKALQVACLDLATVLYEISDLSVKIDIGRIVAAGTRIMDQQMTDRALQWLEGRLQDVDAMLAGKSSKFSSRTAQNIHRVEGLLVDTLAGVVAALGDSTMTPSAVHRSHRLLSSILASKLNVSLDLLQIVAFAPAKDRKTAISVLSTYFPLGTGHNVIARRFSEVTYTHYRQRQEGSVLLTVTEEDSEEHRFIPWRISSKDPIKSNDSRCLTCEAQIHGFCIKCSMCTEVRHLHCLRSPEDTFAYEVIRMSSPASTKTVHAKFGLVPFCLDEKLLDGSSIGGTASSTSRLVGQHSLRLVNLFTLTACGSCQEPLWGTLVQGYACLGGCQRFFHPTCVDKLAKAGGGVCRPGQHVLIDDVTGKGSDPFTVSHKVLQQSSTSALAPLCRADIEARSYDEIAILYGSLWTQQKILENGISGGTIIITFGDKAQSRSDPLGLRHHIKLYEDLLAGSYSKSSAAAADFAHVNNAQRPLGQGYLFSRTFLTYCTALLRSRPDNSSLGSDLDPFDDAARPNADETSTGRMTGSVNVKERLACDLAINDAHIGRVFIYQLNILGLCTIDKRSLLQSGDFIREQEQIAFLLPFLMDATPSVELLVSAIEAMLVDLDLSMNEQALRLAHTQAWPSLLCAPYSLERLGGAIVSWVMHGVSSIVLDNH